MNLAPSRGAQCGRYRQGRDEALPLENTISLEWRKTEEIQDASAYNGEVMAQ